MILIPKFDLGYPHPPHIETSMTRVRGEFKMVLRDLNLRVVYESPWQPNLITDQGLREMGNAATGNWAADLLVGSSSTAPNVLDTSLGGFMAQGFASYDSNNTPVGPNYALQTTLVKRFNAGEATGTIREVGLSDSTHVDNTNISTRALVSPEVTKNADQVLDVYYRVWRYPDIVDRTGTVNIEGTNYDYIVRGMELDENAAPGNFGTHTTTNKIGMRTDSANLACVGDIGTVTDPAPAGATNPWEDAGAGYLGWSGSIVTPYNDWEAGWSLDYAIGNIRSFALRESGHGNSAARGWQVRIGQSVGDGPLVKDNTEELYLTFRVSWGRYP